MLVLLLVENRICAQITSILIEKRLKLKCSADQILTIKLEFASFDSCG